VTKRSVMVNGTTLGPGSSFTKSTDLYESEREFPNESRYCPKQRGHLVISHSAVANWQKQARGLGSRAGSAEPYFQCPALPPTFLNKLHRAKPHSHTLSLREASAFG